MKRTVGLLTLVVAGLFVVGLVQNLPAGSVASAQGEGGCSVATLEGDYLVTGSAEARFDQRDDPSFPRRIIQRWNFDGQGGLTGFSILNSGGLITSPDLDGTYTMDSDRCVATLTIGINQWNIIITRDGSEGAAIRVDTDKGTGLANIATRHLKKG